MQPDRFTIKAQEAVQAAQQLAQERSHQQLDAEHLATALIRQEDSLIPQLLQRLGVPLQPLTTDLEEELGRRAKVQGSAQVYPTSEFQAVLAGAEAEADVVGRVEGCPGSGLVPMSAALTSGMRSIARYRSRTKSVAV